MSVDGSGVERGGVYAGADLANAQRFNTLVWVLWALMLVGLSIVVPPTARGAAIGWTAIIANVVMALMASVSSRRTGFGGLMVWAYCGVLGLAVLTWAAGGFGAPYDEIALGLVVWVALTHPVVVAVPYFLVVALLRLAPVAYEGVEGRLVDVVTSIIMWGLVVVVGGQGMGVVREHRHSLATRGDSALDEARRDSLTGLENRRAFCDDFAGLLARARAEPAPVAVVVMDIDYFKDVNDAYGHLEGDRALRTVVAGLRAGTRPGDWLIRWGGDEFVMVMVGVDDGMAAAVCDRVRNTIAAATSDELWGPISVTFGWTIDDGTSSVEWLLDQADSGLMLAKRQRPDIRPRRSEGHRHEDRSAPARRSERTGRGDG